MTDYQRKLPTTGYWIFVCNTSQWNADEWLALKEDQISYRISGHHQKDFRPGQLGLLRLNDDRRTETQRQDRPKHKAGVYALFRIVGIPTFGPDQDLRHFNDPKGAEPRWRVPLQVLANLLHSPVLADNLPNDADFQYIHRPLQTSTIPISETAFHQIAIGAGYSELHIDDQTTIDSPLATTPTFELSPPNMEIGRRVFIANFGRENYEWPKCLAGNTIATMNGTAEQGFWEAADREGYIAYCLANTRTAAGIPPTRPVASRWYNLMTVIAESSDDIWIHREKEQLWWTISKPEPPSIELEEAPYLPPNDNTVFVCHKLCDPWSNANLKGQRLDWNSLHPRAKEFLFTEGTLQQLSLENAAYARRLIQGGDLSGWHLRSDWKTKVEKSGKSPTKVFSTREKAIWRMVTTASDTASNANGQQVIRTLKNKDFGFGLKEELAQYISTLIDTQEGLCAITGIPFQYDGEYDDVELLCSLDRIDSAGHYERGNLQIVCRFINKWKSDSSDQTFKRLISLIRSTA